VGKPSQPCWKIKDCWWEQFDIHAFLAHNYSPDELQILLDAAPKPKLVSLFEIMQQAQRNVDP
jgi:hypothetical protein